MVVTEGGVVVAHAAVVARELHVAGRPFRTGYVEGVGTEPGRQGRARLAGERPGRRPGPRGLRARRPLDRAARVLRAPRLGALARADVRPARRATVRTPDEDDGVLVLRFGPSADVDLTAPLSCEARAGDDW